MRKGLNGAIAVAALYLLSPAPAAAAPDNTLGMALLGAEVMNDGTLTSKRSGATSAQLVSPGLFLVTFDRNVSQCIYSVTHTSPGDFLNSAATFQANPRGGDVNSVRVFTSSGPDLSHFHLLVFCPR